MPHKSRTQQAKAAVKKQNKKDRLEREEAAGIANAAEGSGSAGSSPAAKKDDKPAKKQVAAATKKEDKPKKVRFQFLHDVRAEMKRVTWPSRTDVLRWSGVVVGALVFFGVYVALLDNVIVTPALVALTSLGA